MSALMLQGTEMMDEQPLENVRENVHACASETQRMEGLVKQLLTLSAAAPRLHLLNGDVPTRLLRRESASSRYESEKQTFTPRTSGSGNEDQLRVTGATNHTPESIYTIAALAAMPRVPNLVLANFAGMSAAERFVDKTRSGMTTVAVRN